MIYSASAPPVARSYTRLSGSRDRARPHLLSAALLEQAAREGEVRIERREGQVFVIKPESGKDCPLDIEGVNLNISTDEVVAIIREGREDRTYTQ